MRYVCLYKPGQERTGPPSGEEMQKMGALIDELTQQGVLLSTEGCKSSASGARVAFDNGKYTVTDGPFCEAKECVGGIAIIKADSKAEAIALTKKFLSVAGRGVSEILEIFDPPEAR